jgi:hypothetical protein
VHRQNSLLRAVSAGLAALIVLVAPAASQGATLPDPPWAVWSARSDGLVEVRFNRMVEREVYPASDVIAWVGRSKGWVQRRTAC